MADIAGHSSFSADRSRAASGIAPPRGDGPSREVLLAVAAFLGGLGLALGTYVLAIGLVLGLGSIVAILAAFRIMG